MPARKKLDVNQLAKSIVDQATGEAPKRRITAKQVAGAKGGAIGGKKRMDALSETERRELAMRGVAARKGAPGRVVGAPKVK